MNKKWVLLFVMGGAFPEFGGGSEHQIWIDDFEYH